MGKRKVWSKFVEGETTFESKGVSIIKLTKRVGVEGDSENIDEYIEIPITSIGMMEVWEELERDIPKPPTRKVQVIKGSQFETEYGFPVNSIVQVFDVTDEKYLKKFSDYKSDFLWRTVIHGIDFEWIDTEGNEITDPKKKTELLKNSGITGFHLEQLKNDIAKLTTDAEESADFLSKMP